MKNTVIYHRADHDGLFCREIAKKFLPADTEFIGWHYGDTLVPMPPEGTVYILDLSPECLCDTPTGETAPYWDRIVWIDHHKSAIEKFDKSIPGYRIDGVAACRLTWQWFSHLNVHESPQDYPLPEKQHYFYRNVPEPISVRLAGEYDIWDKRDPDAETFQHGLRSLELTPEGWQVLLGDNEEADSFTADLVISGRALQFAKAAENEGIIKAYGFDLVFENLTFLACNHARYNSQLFTAGLKPHHQACFGFKFTGKEFEVSLYHAPGHEDIDLSVIASKYGGGGHRGACGFRCQWHWLHGLIAGFKMNEADNAQFKNSLGNERTP